MYVPHTTCKQVEKQIMCMLTATLLITTGWPWGDSLLKGPIYMYVHVLFTVPDHLITNTIAEALGVLQLP